MIRTCKCISPFQDRNYGTNLRVFTEGKKEGKKEVRCTVCGTATQLSDPVQTTKKNKKS